MRADFRPNESCKRLHPGSPKKQQPASGTVGSAVKGGDEERTTCTQLHRAPLPAQPLRGHRGAADQLTAEVVDIMTCIPLMVPAVLAEQQARFLHGVSSKRDATGSHPQPQRGHLQSQVSATFVDGEGPARAQVGAASVRPAPSDTFAGLVAVAVPTGRDRVVHFQPSPATLTHGEVALAQRAWSLKLGQAEYLTTDEELLGPLRHLSVPEVPLLQPYLAPMLRQCPNGRLYFVQFVEFLAQCKTLHALRLHRAQFDRKRAWLRSSIAAYHAQQQQQQRESVASLDSSALLVMSPTFVGSPASSPSGCFDGGGVQALPAREELFSAFCSIAEMAAEGDGGDLLDEEEDSEGGTAALAPLRQTTAPSPTPTAVAASSVIDFLVAFDLQPGEQLQRRAPGSLEAATKRRTLDRLQQQRTMKMRAGALRASASVAVGPRHGSLGSQATAALTFDEFVSLVLTPQQPVGGGGESARSLSPTSRRRRSLQKRLSSFGLLTLRGDDGGGSSAGGLTGQMHGQPLASMRSTGSFAKPPLTGALRRSMEGSRRSSASGGNSDSGDDDDDSATETHGDNDEEERESPACDPLDSALQDIMKQLLQRQKEGEAGRCAQRDAAAAASGVAAGVGSGGAGAQEGRARRLVTRTMSPCGNNQKPSSARLPVCVGAAGLAYVSALSTAVERTSPFSTHRAVTPALQRFCSSREQAKQQREARRHEPLRATNAMQQQQQQGQHHDGAASAAATPPPLGTVKAFNNQAAIVAQLAKENTKHIFEEAEVLLQHLHLAGGSSVSRRPASRPTKRSSSSTVDLNASTSLAAHTPLQLSRRNSVQTHALSMPLLKADEASPPPIGRPLSVAAVSQPRQGFRGDVTFPGLLHVASPSI